ncbi:MAG: hypothetical protein Q4G59_11445, partial [Planctomycetia bacterium]|nr:hypothetical protein [Planctomycetia bacterium]
CANSYKNCYFTIYSFISRNSAYSNGVTLFAGKLRFRYDVKITKKAFSRTKQAMLIFTTEEKDSYLPALVVRKDIGHPPLNRQYGEKLMDIAAQKSNHNTVILPVSTFTENAYIKVFVANDSEESLYFIDGPPYEKLKLEYIAPTFLQRIKNFFGGLFHR